jgi:hypothetical protein
MMKKLVFLMLVFLPVLALGAGETDIQHSQGFLAYDTIETISVQHTIGSYQGVCSLATFVALDTGDILITVTGIANLSQGQKLYIALDSANGILDTIYGETFVSVPYETWASQKIPFRLEYSIKADSAGTVIAPTVNMGCGSSIDAIVVEKVTLIATMIANKHDAD